MKYFSRVKRQFGEHLHLKVCHDAKVYTLYLLIRYLKREQRCEFICNGNLDLPDSCNLRRYR